MGGGISTLFAGAYPELVDKLVLIDGFGPVSKDPSTAVATLRKALDEESKFHSKDINIGGGRLYENVSEAVKARMATVRRFPGEQYISEEAALQLIMRGTYPARAVDTTDENYFDEPSISEAVRFRHDPKLTLPSYTYNTHEQVTLLRVIPPSHSSSLWKAPTGLTRLFIHDVY
jgi:pimeloyl-ACP methyl ester carboxylesterase